MTTFADLGVDPDLVAALASQGILAPFPIQAATIRDAVAGRDLCGKAKTGSGKTLAFSLPLLMRTPPAEPGHPTALVLLPTRELAVQVEAVMDPLAASRDMTSRTFYGGTPIEKDLEALKRRVDVAIGTPGRMIDLVQQGNLHLDAVKVLVLDEADRMADMGFMPQVEWLLRHITAEHQTLLFSATLDGDIDHLVKHYQHDPVRHEILSDSTTVDAMQHRFVYVHQLDKPKVAATIGRTSNRTLIFVRTKRGADRLVEQLLKEGIKAAAIHGDLRQAARERSLARFSEGKLPVLVATDVAARGLHIDAVDTVVHFDPPEDHKTYLHRSGRTARAGATGVAITLVLWDQLLETTKLLKRLGLALPIVEVFSNDPHLENLPDWEPDPAKSVVPS